MQSCASSGMSEEQLIQEKDYREVPIPEEFVTGDYVVPDRWAMYPGGDRGVYSALFDGFRYPREFYAGNLSGRVIVTYEVDTEGLASNPDVKMSSVSGLEKEFEKTLKKMERWIPARKDGQNVPQQYVFVMRFGDVFK